MLHETHGVDSAGPRLQANISVVWDLQNVIPLLFVVVSSIPDNPLNWRSCPVYRPLGVSAPQPIRTR